MMERLKISVFTLNLIIILSVYITSSNCVIVDGDKKEEISPVKHQKHNVSLLIDSYNVKTCGISDPDYDEHEFINMARAGQFPWIASFQIKMSNGDTGEVEDKQHPKRMMYEDLHFCCGTFISSRWILSAAHCFATDSIKKYLNSNRLKVVAGSHKVSSRSPESRNLTIKKIFYHKRFDMKIPVGFDIALVELNDPVKFTQKRVLNPDKIQSEPFFNAACLPRKDHKSHFNETARISGWGLSNPKDPSSMPSKLLTTDILLAKPNECVQVYDKELKSDKPSKQLKQFDDFICASYEKTRDACQSDSGGPLMQYVDNKAVVIGIVSYGIGCARQGVPGLYTRTSAYINWIKDITERSDQASVDFELIESVTQENLISPAEKPILSHTNAESIRKPNQGLSHIEISKDNKNETTTQDARSTTKKPETTSTTSKMPDTTTEEPPSDFEFAE